jgi:hypothetical protein
MLRNILLGLLLANFLVFAWQRWVIPRPVNQPDEIVGLTEPRLQLLEKPGAASTPPDSGSADADVAEQRCIQIGPFPDEDAAAPVRKQLARRDIETQLARRVGELWVGHWVQLEEMADQAEAASVLEKLQRAGLDDAYIFQSTPTYKISLGVFRSLEGAEAVAARARQLDLPIVMVDRTRPGSEVWLTAEMPKRDRLDLEDLNRSTSRILRTEPIECSAVDVGGAAGVE